MLRLSTVALLVPEGDPACSEPFEGFAIADVGGHVLPNPSWESV